MGVHIAQHRAGSRKAPSPSCCPGEHGPGRPSTRGSQGLSPRARAPSTGGHLGGIAGFSAQLQGPGAVRDPLQTRVSRPRPESPVRGSGVGPKQPLSKPVPVCWGRPGEKSEEAVVSGPLFSHLQGGQQPPPPAELNQLNHRLHNQCEYFKKKPHWEGDSYRGGGDGTCEGPGQGAWEDWGWGSRGAWRGGLGAGRAHEDNNKRERAGTPGARLREGGGGTRDSGEGPGTSLMSRRAMLIPKTSASPALLSWEERAQGGAHGRHLGHRGPPRQGPTPAQQTS